jgi:hypothetical protein
LNARRMRRRSGEQRKFAVAAAGSCDTGEDIATDRRCIDLSKVSFLRKTVRSPASSKLSSHDWTSSCTPGTTHLAGADHDRTVFIQNVFPYAPRLLQSTITRKKHIQNQELRINSAATSATTLKCALRLSASATTVSDSLKRIYRTASDLV